MALSIDEQSPMPISRKSHDDTQSVVIKVFRRFRINAPADKDAPPKILDLADGAARAGVTCFEIRLKRQRISNRHGVSPEGGRHRPF